MFVVIITKQRRPNIVHQLVNHEQVIILGAENWDFKTEIVRLLCHMLSLAKTDGVWCSVDP